MHDIRAIREDPATFDAGLARRGLPPASPDLLRIDTARRAAQTELQLLQSELNDTSRQIGAIKKQGGDAAPLMAKVEETKRRIPEIEAEEKSQAAALEAQLSAIPNLPAADVPLGQDEHGNVELRRIGTPPSFAFKPRQHDELGPALGMMDFEAAARMSGSRFVVLKSQIARLHRALASFMLDLHTGANGYTEIDPPVLVREQALYGTNQLPKFADDLFRTTSDHWLIPTAEVSLTNLAREQILDEAALPMRVTAYTLSFRSEAGAAGRDTKGMIRQHQFGKVELVSIAHPDQSEAEHERMTACAEAVLKQLGIAYRVMLLCTGDMGFGARKTYDIEVWLPGQDTYREISSCSNCGDFQARRMAARFRPKEGKGTQFVHTLNGSGLAVGRTLIAVMENYQQEDGSIEIPEVLQSYMGGVKVIRADG